MAERHPYARYYERYSSLAPLTFLWDGLRARSPVRRVSQRNRASDYLQLRDDPARLAIHRELNAYLFKQSAEWTSHDYGEGYFYQSCRPLGISGLRDTAARAAAMNLGERVRDRTVLEVGCNTGFLMCEAAASARHIHGVEINPYLVSVASAAARQLGVANITVDCAAWETFTGPTFGAVVSFANHSTYDGNTRQTVAEYLDRCVGALAPDGLFLFESHPPAHEGAGLDAVCRMIGERFDVLEQRVLEYGTFLDRGRTFIVGRKRLAR